VSDTPVVERTDTAVSAVPADALEADGTLGRDGTTPVPAAVRRGDVTGLGNPCAPAVTARVVDGPLVGVVTALRDLRVRLLGLPLMRLPDAARGEVPVHGSGGFTAFDHVRVERPPSDGVPDPGGSVTAGAGGAPGPGSALGTERARTHRMA
jgi:hypothetical protein